MQKDRYELTEMEIIKFYSEDVLVPSGELSEDETPFLPKP